MIDEISVYTDWNGAVSLGGYEKILRRLDLSKKRCLDWELMTAEERMLWKKVWSFEDKPGE